MGDGGFFAGDGPLSGKKAAFLSLGCKVNAYETEAMRELFEEAGARTVEFWETADIYVVNTCTVTNIADRKSRQMLHRAKKKNPGGIVVAAGCYVQAAGEALKKELAVDILVGNNHKKDVVNLVVQYIKQKEKSVGELTGSCKTGQLVSVTEIAREKTYEGLSIRTHEKTRAYIKVQDGCNQFCTYCIIPFARGRIRSRSMGEVEQEVRRLAAIGYQEIVLTGIHLSSYGMEDYPEKERFSLVLPDGDMPLVKLVKRLDLVEGITRIRLGSLEPRIVTARYAAALAETKVCPHFHLSLQSGCDTVLQRMNRRYGTAEYMEGCKILRQFFDRPAITTDVIAGFPGETEEEFRETKQFVQKIQFAQMHIFKYSRREGTKAAGMPGQVDEEVKARRSEELLALEKEMRHAYEASFAGQETEVLLEEGIEIAGEHFMVGHDSRYMKFAVRTDEDLSNMCIKGHINGDFAGEIPIMERKQSKQD